MLTATTAPGRVSHVTDATLVVVACSFKFRET